MIRRFICAAALLLGALALPTAVAANNYNNEAGKWFGSKTISGIDYPIFLCGDAVTGLAGSCGNGGSGGSLSAKANASTQTSTEGATTDPLSMDLSRNLRVVDAAVVARLDTMISALSDTSASLVKFDQTTPGTTNGVVINNTSPIKTDNVIPAASTDVGASVGTTASTLVASSSSRRGYKIQNQSATADCYVSFLSTATQDYHSLKIAAGTYYESPPTHVETGAMSVVCSAASTSVYARVW